MDFKEVVKEHRSTLGISQIDLAEMAGISLATVKDISLQWLQSLWFGFAPLRRLLWLLWA